MDMSKYVKMYVSESQDRLQRMDGLLLTLEQDSGDRGAIDTLFREAHSIKGMSASMGYEELAKVSHRMEDFLEQFRGGTGALERRGVDILFEGVDLLRRAVEEIAAGSAPTLAVRRIRGQDGLPDADERATPSGAARDRRRCRRPRPGRRHGCASPGRSQFAVDLRIAPDAPLPSARAYITLRRVRDLGELIRSAPTVEQVQSGQFSGGALHPGGHDAQRGRGAGVPGRPPRRGLGGGAPRGGRGSARRPRRPAAPVGARRRPPARRNRRSAPGRRLSGRPPRRHRRSPLPAAPRPAAAPRRPVTMMRVDTRLLDDLMDQVGELVTANGSLLEVSHGIDSPRLHESAGRVEGLVKALQQQAMKLRMMPLEMIADRFPRAVRDLARKRGKEVTFEVLGKETELDRAILEELARPDSPYPAERHRSRDRARRGAGAARQASRGDDSSGGDERARERGDPGRRRRSGHRPGGPAPGGDGAGRDQPRAGRDAAGFRGHDADHAARFQHGQGGDRRLGPRRRAWTWCGVRSSRSEAASSSSR